jgi:uncharacterized protein (DUF1330 family)
MPAYIVSVCHITNMSENMKKYAAESARLIHQNGGKYIVRGKAAGVVEGDAMKDAVTIIAEFPTLDQLKAFVYGDEYQQQVKPLRAGTGSYEIGIFESPPPAKA